MCQLWGHSFHNAQNPPIWPVSPLKNWTRVTCWTPKDPAAARIIGSLFGTTLQWRHNERNGISNHRRLDCLLNRLFRRRSKKTSKLRVTVCVTGEFPAVTGEFPAQKPVTRNMFPFDDVIMKTGNIDVGATPSRPRCLHRFALILNRIPTSLASYYYQSMALEISPSVVCSLIYLYHYSFVPTNLFWIYEFVNILQWLTLCQLSLLFV